MEQISEQQSLNCLEMFAGAGGLALGLHQAGFKHVNLIEWNKSAVQTLKLNHKLLNIHPDNILENDARFINYSRFMGKIDLLSGGPPCQPFSTSGRNLGPDDDRNMFPVFLDVIGYVMPKAILIENVKGLVREKFKFYFQYILKRIQFPHLEIGPNQEWTDHYNRLKTAKEKDFLDEEQYVVTYQVIDTADYGVPQRRQRVLIVGLRKDLFSKPFRLPKSHSINNLLRDQWVTGEYWRRHGISSEQYSGPNSQRTYQHAVDVSCLKPWLTVRDAIGDLPNPVERGMNELIPNHTQHPGARIYKSHVGSYYDFPAKALKAGTNGTPGGENMVRIPGEINSVRYFTTSSFWLHRWHAFSVLSSASLSLLELRILGHHSNSGDC